MAISGDVGSIVADLQVVVKGHSGHYPAVHVPTELCLFDVDLLLSVKTIKANGQLFVSL